MTVAVPSPAPRAGVIGGRGLPGFAPLTRGYLPPPASRAGCGAGHAIPRIALRSIRGYIPAPAPRANMSMSTNYDIIIIGAGHNGLVTAAYLAKAGRKVLVLERRELVGGACVTEEIWPGFKVSTAAYVNSLLRPEIIRDLKLKEHGFELLPRNPSSFTPFPDGRYLLMGPDAALNHREISKFSVRDAEALPRYEQMLLRVADFIEPTLVETPPDPWSWRLGELWKLAKLGWRFRKLGRDGALAIDILTGAARAILDRWFESEQLKVTLATDAIIGAMASPSMPGTA